MESGEGLWGGENPFPPKENKAKFIATVGMHYCRICKEHAKLD